jgi:hypothetical protein
LFSGVCPSNDHDALVKIVWASIGDLFWMLFDSDDYVITAVSHPAFKFAWLNGVAEKIDLDKNFLSESRHQGNPLSNNELFNFEEYDSPTSDKIDLLAYLCDKDKSLLTN